MHNSTFLSSLVDFENGLLVCSLCVSVDNNCVVFFSSTGKLMILFILLGRICHSLSQFSLDSNIVVSNNADIEHVWSVCGLGEICFDIIILIAIIVNFIMYAFTHSKKTDSLYITFLGCQTHRLLQKIFFSISRNNSDRYLTCPLSFSFFFFVILFACLLICMFACLRVCSIYSYKEIELFTEISPRQT